MSLQFDHRNVHIAFGTFDRVTIEGTAFRPLSRNEVGWLMEMDGGPGICQQFTHGQISRLVENGRIRAETDYFSAAGARRAAIAQHTPPGEATDGEDFRDLIEAYCARAGLEMAFAHDLVARLFHAA